MAVAAHPHQHRIRHGQAWYIKLKPIFLGMILGQLMCGAFWIVVDLITGEVKNYIYIGVP